MGFSNPEARDPVDESRGMMQAKIELGSDLDRTNLNSLNSMLFGVDGVPGYLQAYEQMAPRLSALDRESTAANREADIASVEQLGPRARAAMDAADPEQAALMTELNRQMMTDLQAGDSLTPEQQRYVQQYTRAAGAARGMNGSNVGATNEALNQFMMGQDVRGQRMNRAMGMASLNKNVRADPYMTVLGRQSNSVNQAIAGTATGAPQNFDPFSGYASQLYGQNSSQQRTGLQNLQTGMAIGGEFIGSVAKGVMCWVAREVFGERDPQWILFRAWLLEDAPGWFRALYWNYGPQFAKFIGDKPWLKRIIRKWMVARIEGKFRREREDSNIPSEGEVSHGFRI